MKRFTTCIAIAATSALPLLASAQLAGSGGQPANPAVPSASTRANDPATAVKTDPDTKYGQQNQDSTSTTDTHRSKTKKSGAKSGDTTSSDRSSYPSSSYPASSSPMSTDQATPPPTTRN